MKEKEAKVTDYKFMDFAHVLHDCAKSNDRVEFFTEELFESIVNDDFEDIVGDNSSKTFGYYYNGRSINELCRKIGNYLDEDKFVDWLNNLELDDDHWNILYRRLKEIGVKFDKNKKNKSIARYFKNMIFEKSIIKSNDNLVFKMNVVNDYIDRTINQENKKLDSKISPYYEYKRSYNSNETNIFLKAKSDEIAKKVPIKVNGTFDIENASEDELYNLNHLNELWPLVNYNNEPLVLPRIKETTKSINGVIVPNESIEFNEIGKNLILFPRNDLNRIFVNFSIYNSNMFVNLNNICLNKIYLSDRTYFTNKNRNMNFPFDFEIVFIFNEEKTEMSYGFNLGLRPVFSNDIKSVLKYYKIVRLLEDKNSVVKITTPELDVPLYYKENYGKYSFTEEEYKKISYIVDDFEKVLFLEGQLDTKFEFDIDWLRMNKAAIDIAYASFKKNELFVIGPTSWTLELDKDAYCDLKEKMNMRFETKLSTINLFEKIYSIPDIKLFMNNAFIEKINEMDKIKTILISTNSISISSFSNKKV